LSVDAIVENVDYQGQSARYFLRVGDHQMQAINMIEDHPFAAGAKVACGSVRKTVLPCRWRAIREIRKPPFLPEPFPAAGAGRRRAASTCGMSTAKRYLDGSSGAMVSNIGHSNPRVLDRDAAADGEIHLRLPAAFRDRTKRAACRQGRFAVARGMDKVFFVSGGSEAVEAPSSWRGNTR
jgi:hypothetical protein